jgi:N-formylglutamate amidohydrolase
MNKILLHIPHANTNLPKCFWQNVCVEKDIVKKFVQDITDTNTDKLFGKNCYKKIKFGYSRVFCDVEKFADDSQEEMSKFGMSVVYSKTNNGVQFANITQDYLEKVLQKYYWPYHSKLDKLAKKYLATGQNVILIDCHSFSQNIIMFDERKHDLPDICIGYNQNYNSNLVNMVQEYFSNLGYSVKLNYPYSGAMVPNAIIGKNADTFASIMLEINKSIYTRDKQKFCTLQKQINRLFLQLKNLDI